MSPLAPRHSFNFGGTTHNIYHANKGEGLPRHEHNYPHATVCHAGSCVIRKDGKEVVLTNESTPAILVGSEWHEIEALEDGTVFENSFTA